MKFDNILDELKGFGLYQVLMLLTLSIPRMVTPGHFLLNNFIAWTPPHRCSLSSLTQSAPELFRNLTQEQTLAVSVPLGVDGQPDSCRMFTEPQLQLLDNISAGAQLPAVACGSGWVYDNHTFTSTVATEWDLVCDRKSQTKTLSTYFFLGVMLGAVVFGYLSDRFGRRNTILVSYILTIVFGFSSAFANSYIMFAVLRFFTGVSITGIGIISLILILEWVDTASRSLVVTIGGMSWVGGNMLLAGCAWLIRDWRTLTMTVTAPLVVAVICWWWLPESARWLLVHGRVEEAERYLNKCAKINRRPQTSKSKLESIANEEAAEEQKRHYNYLHLFKTPRLRRISLLIGVVWIGVAVTYYGISLNVTGFGLNMFLTHFIYSAIEVPAKVMAYLLLKVIGRRTCMAGSLLLTGLCVATNIFIPADMWRLRATVAILGKGLSEASFTTIFLYTAEIYPTVIRQNALGYNNSMSRVGVAMAPLILLLEDVWPPLPQIIISLMPVACSLLALLLPETRGVRLPESIDDVEKQRVMQVFVETAEDPGILMGSKSAKDSPNEGN